MGELSIMDKIKGDVRVSWDEDKLEEVEMAKETFERYIEKGWFAYEVTRRGKKTEIQVREFDPELGEVIMIPPVAGG